MAEKYWKAGQDVITTVEALVANHHPHLALCVEEIAVLFKEKATVQGAVVVMGKTAKASELFGVLGETKWKFIITLAMDSWSSLSDKERVALLDHHLCACKAEEKTGGNMAYSLVPPDVAFYQEEIVRHGFWRTSGTAATQALIEEIFGTKAP